MSEFEDYSYRSNDPILKSGIKTKTQKSPLASSKRDMFYSGRLDERIHDEVVQKKFSGLIAQTGNTTNFIVNGFWMQGDFVVYLTIDEANYVYIETYFFDSESIEPICEKVFLCDKSSF
jgi:hypothetical protein